MKKFTLIKKLTFSSIDENIAKWSKLMNCAEIFGKCEDGVGWVREYGNYSESGKKKFKQAMSIDPNTNLENACKTAIIVGIICQESSFATQINNLGEVKGVFQLSEASLKEFSKNNPEFPKINFPNDIDDLNDLSLASKVASWYYAKNLQRLTVSTDYYNPVKKIGEAVKFALASYNGGPTLVTKAREITTEIIGGEKEVWEKVKMNLENAGASKERANEMRDYVEKVMAYSDKSEKSWCN